MTIWPNGESIFHSTSTLPHVLTKQSLCCSLVAKSYLTLVTAWAVVCLAPLSMGFSRHSPGLSMATEVGCHALLQGIVLTQGSSPGLPHCRQILYQLSHKGSPGILEWVAYPFSRRSSQPRDQAQVSRIAGGFFTI